VNGVVEVLANASDESGIKRVDFYYYGPALSYVLIGSDSVAPYSVQWNTSRVVDGSYYLFVEAYDNYDNKKSTEDPSERVYVTVRNVPVVTTSSSTSTTSTSEPAATSSTSSTTTTTMPSGVVPVIRDLRAVFVSTDEATVVWSTDVECIASIYYGKAGSSMELSQNGSLYAYSHSFTLTGLSENTGYSYKVYAVNRNGTEAVSYGYFTTAKKYIEPISVDNASLNGSIVVNISEAEMVIEMSLNDTVENGSLNITYSTGNPVNMSLAVAEIGRYMKIEASPDVHKSLASVVLKVYYSDEELEDGNINESTLAMYWYNETAGSWIRLSTDLDWVHGTGVNMQQNYVWANVSHFSDYTVGGNSICPLRGDRPLCGVVSLQEVVNYILRWAEGRAQLSDVVNLINGWMASEV